MEDIREKVLARQRNEYVQRNTLASLKEFIWNLISGSVEAVVKIIAFIFHNGFTFLIIFLLAHAAYDVVVGTIKDVILEIITNVFVVISLFGAIISHALSGFSSGVSAVSSAFGGSGGGIDISLSVPPASHMLPGVISDLTTLESDCSELTNPWNELLGLSRYVLSDIIPLCSMMRYIEPLTPLYWFLNLFLSYFIYPSRPVPWENCRPPGGSEYFTCLILCVWAVVPLLFLICIIGIVIYSNRKLIRQIFGWFVDIWDIFHYGYSRFIDMRIQKSSFSSQWPTQQLESAAPSQTFSQRRMFLTNSSSQHLV